MIKNERNPSAQDTTVGEITTPSSNASTTGQNCYDAVMAEKPVRAVPKTELGRASDERLRESREALSTTRRQLEVARALIAELREKLRVSEESLRKADAALAGRQPPVA